MVSYADPETTVDEIVVALREAKRSASGTPSLSVVGGQDATNSSVTEPRSVLAKDGITRNHDAPGNLAETIRSSDLGTLREEEIARLLAENARLNGRVMSLINVIERERLRSATPATESESIEATRVTVAQEVRSALEAELRPLLLAVLRLLERRQASPVAQFASNEPARQQAARPSNEKFMGDTKRKVASSGAPPMPSEWLLQLIGKLEGQEEERIRDQAIAEPTTVPSRSGLRQRRVSPFPPERR